MSSTFLRVKGSNYIYNSESMCVFNNIKEKKLVGMYVDRQVVPFDKSMIPIAKKYGYSLDHIDLESSEEENEGEQEDNEEESPDTSEEAQPTEDLHENPNEGSHEQESETLESENSTVSVEKTVNTNVNTSSQSCETTHHSDSSTTGGISTQLLTSEFLVNFTRVYNNTLQLMDSQNKRISELEKQLETVTSEKNVLYSKLDTIRKTMLC